MSFDAGRDAADRLDKIERHLATIVTLLRELMGKPAPKGWLASMTREEYKRKFRVTSDQASGPDDNLPPSGGVPPEEFFARRER